MSLWKTALIALALAVFVDLLCYCAMILLVGIGSPSWALFILIPLFAVAGLVSIIALILSLLLAYGFLLWINHVVVTSVGIKTTATVISSQRCEHLDDDNACLCGFYSYRDWLRWEHKSKFRICVSWPSKERWATVMQTYGLGAQNPVYYLPWLPFIHEMHASD